MQYESLVSSFEQAFLQLYGPLALSSGAIWLDFVATYLNTNILIRTVSYGLDIFCPTSVVDALLVFLSTLFQITHSPGKISVYGEQPKLIDSIRPKVNIKGLRLTYSTNVSHVKLIDLGDLFDTQTVFSYLDPILEESKSLSQNYSVNIGRSIGTLETKCYFDRFSKTFKKMITPKEVEWSDIHTIEYSITVRIKNENLN